jgi:hypothetical protein
MPGGRGQRPARPASSRSGPDAATILAPEHWSLLGFRSLIWNEAMSRATVFLSVLSAAIITLALLSTAAGGSHTTTAALVLLPVVLFLGIATHIRVVQINTEEIEVMLAMNRLRHAYLEITPGLEPYFTTGHHDDAPGLAASFLLPPNPGRLGPWGYFLVNTPTVIATWTPRSRRRSSCWLCGKPVHPQPSPWSWRRRRSCSCGLRWSPGSAIPWTRWPGRRRGSPRRQTTPEQRFVAWRQPCARTTVRPRRCAPCSTRSR